MSQGTGLNIIVFGMPGSGKSALLGALWQVAQSQEAILGGKISDPSGGLAELHAALYSQQAADTAPQLAGHPVSLNLANGEPLEATLVDCDGGVAQDFLAQPHTALAGRAAAARAIMHADALILVVDPTSGAAQLEKEFQQFCTFVQSLETHRSHRYEVGGLPVYVVLTKCDKLSKPTDAGSAWVQRIEEGKRKIDKRFQDFLGKLPNRETLPFGRVDVRVWATAVRRPQLADRQARNQEPYGVAELFRQCFQAAGDFHHARRKAHDRLKVALLGFLGLIVVMALAAAAFLVIRPSAEMTTLESKIREALPGPKGSSTERLKEPIDKRVKKLDEIVDDPAFAKLPGELQDEVKNARKEIEEYQAVNKQFLETVKDPKFAKNDEDLAKIEDALKRLQLPEEYQTAWQETKLARRQQQIVEDIKNLRTAVKDEEAWFRGQIDEGKKLKKQGGLVIAGSVAGKERDAWFSQVQEFLNRQPRFKDTDSVAQDKSPSIRYGIVYRFPQVERTQNELRGIKKNLEDLRKQAQ